MRFRSIGISASNIEEYLAKVKEKENSYIEEATLAHINLISLGENDSINDEYEFLGHKSDYKMKKYDKFRKKRKRISSTNFRKKIFFRHKRNRINSESNNNSSKINLLED